MWISEGVYHLLFHSEGNFHSGYGIFYPLFICCSGLSLEDKNSRPICLISTCRTVVELFVIIRFLKSEMRSNCKELIPSINTKKHKKEIETNQRRGT